MGSVKLKETSSVGEVHSSVEYEFSDSVDFLAWESDKQGRLTNALKSFVGSLDPMGSVNYPEETFSADIQVKKKDVKH